jgi:hypothetical protein
MMSKVKYLRFVAHGEPQFESDTWALHLGRENNFNSRMNSLSCRYILFILLNDVMFWSMRLIGCIVYRACCRYASVIGKIYASLRCYHANHVLFSILIFCFCQCPF